MIDYEALLRREVIPALGCTEPIACAYAASWAASVLGSKPDSISVSGSRNILKNAMSVGIPGSDMVGLPIAAALGALGGKPDRQLEVLADITPEQVSESREMVTSGKVSVTQEQDVEPLYVSVTLTSGAHTAKAVVQRCHTQLTDLILDGRALRHEELPAVTVGAEQTEQTSVQDIRAFCKSVDAERLAFLKAGGEMNLRMSELGLSGGYGMGVGRSLADAGRSASLVGDDIGSDAVAATAAACDARMAGAQLPVMSVAGSGNQGLVCTIPVAVYARRLGKDEQSLLRAVALSELITIHIKRQIGRLSALCGCGIAASVGAGCGILYQMGGSDTQSDYVIKNMIAGITGMVCDGAKAGCALKVANALGAATQCAALALNNVCVPSIDGIVDGDLEKTIANLGSVGRDGMAQADQLILNLMTSKSE